MRDTSNKYLSVADPECARGGGVSHILAEKRGVSFTLFKKMHENAIFSLRRRGGGVRRVRPMLDPPLFISDDLQRGKTDRKRQEIHKIVSAIWGLILAQVTIYRRLWRSKACDISSLVREYEPML